MHKPELVKCKWVFRKSTASTIAKPIYAQRRACLHLYHVTSDLTMLRPAALAW